MNRISNEISIILTVLILQLFVLISPSGAADKIKEIEVQKAADAIIANYKTFISDYDALTKLPPDQRVNFTLTQIESRVYSKIAGDVEKKLKQEAIGFAKKALRAYYFQSEVIPIVKLGKGLDWPGLDKYLNEKASSQVNFIINTVNDAKAGWSVIQTFNKRGPMEGFKDLSGKAYDKLAGAYIPGWGYFKLGIEFTKALGEFVLSYANETAKTGMFNEMYSEAKGDPAGFAKWIVDKSPDALKKDIDYRWNDSMVEYGRLWEHKGTEIGNEEMKARIFDTLMDLRNQVAQKKHEQDSLERELQRPINEARDAEAALMDAARSAMADADKTLKEVRDFQYKIHGYKKTDSENAANEIRTAMESSNKPAATGYTYTPLDRSSILNPLKNALELITDDFSKGYDLEKMNDELYAHYLAKSAAIKAKETEWHTLNNNLTAVRKSYSEQARSLLDQYGGDQQKANEAASQLYRSLVAPHESAILLLQNMQPKDTALLAEEESIIFSEAYERHQKMISSLDSAMKAIQKELDSTREKYTKEKNLIDKEADKLNYPGAFRNPDYMEKNLYFPPAYDSRQMPGTLADELSKLELIKNRWRMDEEIASKIEPWIRKLDRDYELAIILARNSYEKLVQERYRKIQKDVWTSNGVVDYWFIDNPYYSQSYTEASAKKTEWQSLSQIRRVIIFNTDYANSLSVWQRPVEELRDLEQKPVNYSKGSKYLDEKIQAVNALITQDETALRFNKLMAELSIKLDPFKIQPDNQYQFESSRVAGMFTAKDGSYPNLINPLQSDGYKYLTGLTKAYEENREKMALATRLKNAFGNAIRYQYLDPGGYYPKLESWTKIPERIKLFEDAFKEADKIWKTKVDGIPKYVSDIHAKYESLKVSLLNISHLESLYSHVGDLTKAWADGFGEAVIEKAVKDLKHLYSEMTIFMVSAREQKKLLDEARKRDEEEWKKKMEYEAIFGPIAGKITTMTALVNTALENADYGTIIRQEAAIQNIAKEYIALGKTDKALEDQIEKLRASVALAVTREKNISAHSSTAIRDLYNEFRNAYESRNDAKLMSFMDDDWQAGDGTTLSDLQANLRRICTGFDDIKYDIQNMKISAGSGGRFVVSYDVTITSRIFDGNLKHEEKSSVNEEVLLDKSGRPRISRTLNGRFWYVE